MKLQFSLKLLLLLLLASAVAVSLWVDRIERQKQIATAIQILENVPDNSFLPPLNLQPASLARAVNHLIGMNHSDAVAALEAYAQLASHRDNLETVAHLLLDPVNQKIPTLESMSVVDGVLVQTEFFEGSELGPPNENLNIFDAMLKNARFRDEPIAIADDPIPVFQTVLENTNDIDGTWLLRGIINEVGYEYNEFGRGCRSYDEFKDKVLTLKVRLNRENYRYEVVD